MLPQWNVKDLGHSAKSSSGRLHLNTHTSLTQGNRSGLTMPLCRHSVGTYLEKSSRAPFRGTFGHNRLSSLSHCGLILRAEIVCANKCPLQKNKTHTKKLAQARSNESCNILKKSSQSRKKPPPSPQRPMCPNDGVPRQRRWPCA